MIKDGRVKGLPDASRARRPRKSRIANDIKRLYYVREACLLLASRGCWCKYLPHPACAIGDHAEDQESRHARSSNSQAVHGPLTSPIGLGLTSTRARSGRTYLFRKVLTEERFPRLSFKEKAMRTLEDTISETRDAQNMSAMNDRHRHIIGN